MALALALGGCGGGEEKERLALGVNVAQLFDGAANAALVEPALARAEHDGIREARADALWAALEPAPGRFDWAFADQVAGALARHGIRWWAVLDYAPAWAAMAPLSIHSAPRDPADFGTFAGAFARRYGPGGAFWRAHPELPDLPVRTIEVWNEPDSRIFWVPGPDPATYARSFAAAARAVPSDVRLVVGGLVGTGPFLTAVLAAEPGIKDRIAAVGVHPYGLSSAAVLDRLGGYRAAADRAGLEDVPFAVTEVGWATRPPGNDYFASEEERGRLIATTFPAMARTPCVESAFLSSYTTPERRPGDVGDWFGIVPPDGGEGPSRPAFRTLVTDPPAAARCP